MSRSPLAYPLVRSADGEIGGAADLQTDVMRFMAILALCLVAIFALVQAIPMAPVPQPVETVTDVAVASPAPVAPAAAADPVPAQSLPDPARALPEPAAPATIETPLPEVASSETPIAEEASTETPLPVEPGFTLRFASDSALMRAVAAHGVGVYAIEPGRALRMTVSESRISFWDASIPNAYHEMEASTVPGAVIAAVSRTGISPDSVAWGVTLPGRMRGELDELMREHAGGLLVIGVSGAVHWEAPQ